MTYEYLGIVREQLEPESRGYQLHRFDSEQTALNFYADKSPLPLGPSLLGAGQTTKELTMTEQHNQIDLSGPAFPQAIRYPEGGTHSWDGMSLRDWLAGKALQGILTRPFSEYPSLPGDTNYCDHFAFTAYAYADAMLAARRNV